MNKELITKYKVGDWIRAPKHNHIFQFSSTFIEEGIEYISDGYDDIYGQQGWTIDEVELWKPQSGEWVWINTREDTLPFIACLITQIKVDNTLVFTDYSYTTRGKRKDILIHPNELISLEPFIGELPSFLKEMTNDYRN